MTNANNGKKAGASDLSLSRRHFVGAAAAVAAFTYVPKRVLGQAGRDSANNKLNIAGIGVGGQGGSDINGVSSENIAFLCDVDLNRASGTIKKYPNAKVYRDFRVMLEKEAKNIDAVVIGAPDHIHAPAAIMAMKMGKHVYCEKPMAHTIYEARRMTQVAKETGVVTQMGNQGHAGEGLRLYREFIQDGAIGTVREVHVWSDRAGTAERPWWPQGIGRPTQTIPVPEHLDWDLWLGPARWRPYAKFPNGRGGEATYVPFNWRGWWDFGCGAIGDMAVHNADPAFFALDLDAPTAVEAETSGVNDETLPIWNIIRFEFPAQGNRPAIRMTWYDGSKLPPRPDDLEEGRRLGDNGILFVGDKGKLLGGSHAGVPRLIPEARMKEYGKPPQTLPRSPGHHKEWIDACKAGKPQDAKSGFWYAGPFTEALLVGNLAVRLQKRVEWDAKAMRSPNCPEADNYITKFYRAGYSIM
ncbi:MAG: Gfo/Idh/MocA family oxidoreductase [Sedimentisphaerales bacterium]|jgi:predicted dehydrogenase|nr:Gfo/Idh/MocA family oxidoreductase [Sedimentisphaerales bacterium]HNY77054.1 Gfo/Idh/MocA family oxidoreductase [Sedimentisphaerales bacterium]HOC62531.1 Gfo/Idh/MocA family oxidoreductase [Sedimentisphaerales bacterium]HOH63049.1 Gfo/Idh/MocA family oxidoreductase [Sedimentisphaerales bacterium]HQA89193.1 Gfo/Idh/MocA family oxidoreductase [Sedimentisphaerales bacterium]